MKAQAIKLGLFREDYSNYRMTLLSEWRVSISSHLQLGKENSKVN